MEVHHHPSRMAGERKAFRDYFLEFLMIFLAVTLGFFAESLRENITRRQKEEQLMKMMAEDLRADTAKLDYSVLQNTEKIASLDTLRHLVFRSVEGALPDTLTRKMYYIFRNYGGNTYPFDPSERALSQFEKNDAFSLVRKQNVSDSIMSYREYNNRLGSQLAVFENYYQRQAFDLGVSVFNSEILEHFLTRDSASAFLHLSGHFQLLTNDRNTLLIFAGRLMSSRSVLYNYVRQMTQQKENAIRLIALIDKEYRFKNE